MKTTLALLVALSLTACAGETVAPALAQDAPGAPSPFADPACPKMDEVTALLDKQHEDYVILDVTSLLNVSTTSPTRVLVATFGKYAVFGYEDTNGCLTGPTPIAEIAPKIGV
jgi:hypothetical protein